MDSITHLTQKLLQERARANQPQQPQQPLPETAPPPYSESDMDSSDSEDEDDEEPPMKLIINAAHRIQGSNNLVPTSSTPLADATKFSTLLLHAVNQIHAANARRADGNTRGPRGSLKVHLTINCGLEIVGDRNVVGAVGIKPRERLGSDAAQGSAVTTGAVAGAKRKAEDTVESDSEPESKKIALGNTVKE